MIDSILAASGTDQAEHWSFVATIFGAIWAAVWAVKQWRDERARRREDQAKEREVMQTELRQREQELRWKQAELARQLLDDIFDWPPSRNAWDMVDGILKLKDQDGKTVIVAEAGIHRALKLTETEGKKTLKDSQDERQQEEEAFIRDCFDSLFYYIERLERSLRTGVLRFEDLAAPSGYYVKLMATEKRLHREYSEFIRFDGAIAFMNRFPEWANREG